MYEGSIMKGSLMGAAQHQTAGLEQRRESPVDQAMNRLAQTISVAEDVVAMLESRTNMVRAPTPQNVATEKPPHMSGNSPLSIYINDQCNRLERLNHNLRNLTQELEL